MKSLGLDNAIKGSLAPDLSLKLALKHSLSFTNGYALALDQELILILDQSLEHSLNIDDFPFQKSLQSLKDRLLESQEKGYQWWQNNGDQWLRDLWRICIDHRNIGHDWQFTKKQVDILNQYYAANLLLVECMNRSYVSKKVREEIESTMLLPSKK
ncbi:MAG: NACHT C-terminal helical domain 2-containing protein [Pseudanabaena sp.]